MKSNQPMSQRTSNSVRDRFTRRNVSVREIAPRKLAVAWLALAIPVVLTAAEAPLPAFVQIDAGEFERTQIPVSFPLPHRANGSTTVPALALARVRAGKITQTFPVQRAADGQASVTIDHLAPGSHEEFRLITNTPPAHQNSAGLTAQRQGSQLFFTRAPGGTNPASTESRTQPLFAYQAEPGELPRADIKNAFRRGGYIHPIYTAGGALVTDDFPPNHVHHHGIWGAWTHTEFQGRKPDFWNMGDGKGRVEFVALDESWDGPVLAGFRARHRFVDLTAQPPIVALHETWTVTVYASPADAQGTWYFDLTSEQRCATASPLALPEYRYGGIGLRGNRAWNGSTNAQFLTANGESDRVKGHATRARWCDLNGIVGERRAGLAVLGHPSNFRFPEPMRIHPDEPFFNFAPQQAGDMALKPGEVYVSRYRFVVHDGAPNPATLDRLWHDFASPPKVTLVPAAP